MVSRGNELSGIRSEPQASWSGIAVSANTVTAHATSSSAPIPRAHAGPAKTSRPTPATRLTTANAQAFRPPPPATAGTKGTAETRSEEHTSELQSQSNL